jgi:type II secretory pathway pseudopilin PulG
MARSSPTGSGLKPRRASRRRGGGFTYLGILLAVVFLGIALAATGMMWATTVQREREAQLLFVGHAFRSAVESYYMSGHQLPRELDDLVQDKRVPLPRRHLRRIYLDPMTGHADWQILRDPDGGIIGVSSTSQRAPLKRAGFAEQDAQFEGVECYCEWRFEFSVSRTVFRRRSAGSR